MAFSWTDVQTKVAHDGFLSLLGPDGIDGKPGRSTQAAVRAWQKAHPPLETDGVVGTETLKAMGLIKSNVIVTTDLPEVPWIIEGRKRLGMSEIKDNKALAAWLKSDGSSIGDPAKVPWCGDFIQTCLALTLPQEILPGNPFWALNWAKFGKPVPDDGGYYFGSIGCKSRDGGGHVFFIVGFDDHYVHVLGGNQSNSVSVTRIPRADVVAMRAPSTWNLPLVKMSRSVFAGSFVLNGSEA